MSMTKEMAQQHLKDPAVFCCRRQKGLVISEADLEDPDIFDDMEEAGLLKLSDDGLTVEQVLGSTLTKDVEALTPITKDVLDHVHEVSTEDKKAPAASAEPSVPAETEALRLYARYSAPEGTGPSAGFRSGPCISSFGGRSNRKEEGHPHARQEAHEDHRCRDR